MYRSRFGNELLSQVRLSILHIYYSSFEPILDAIQIVPSDAAPVRTPNRKKSVCIVVTEFRKVISMTTNLDFF